MLGALAITGASLAAAIATMIVLLVLNVKDSSAGTVPMAMSIAFFALMGLVFVAAIHELITFREVECDDAYVTARQGRRSIRVARSEIDAVDVRTNEAGDPDSTPEYVVVVTLRDGEQRWLVDRVRSRAIAECVAEVLTRELGVGQRGERARVELDRATANGEALPVDAPRAETEASRAR
jgi:hypothetical protein